MGSCFSKSKEEPWDSEKTRSSGNRRFTSSEQKLGNNAGSNTRGENQISEKQTNNRIAETPYTQNQGRTLGGQESGNLNPNSREAVAKAAELRYNKQKEQWKDSQDKLKSMSKKSKKEKGLQV